MLEIIAETVEDAAAAEAGGADQIDLKSNLLEGGLTPTAGMLASIRSRVDIDVIVMIRPHARSTVYSPADIEVMCHDIRQAVSLGADGFLLGANTEDKMVDMRAVERFQRAADGIPLHFHMFWMETQDQEKTLEQLIELGAASVRTSGGLSITSKAPDGINRIKKQHQQAAARIELFLAGGVCPDNVEALVAGTGVINAHAGTGVRIPETAHGTVCEAKVRDLRIALDRAAAIQLN